MPLRPTFAFAMLALLACLCVAPWQSAPAAETVRSPTQQPGPEAWILPPPWPGKGRCLFEMVRREAEWSQTRRLVRGIGYWPLLLNNGHSDNEIRELFVKLKAWRLGFALEVPVLKGDHWCGDSLPLQAKGAFDLLQQYAKRFRSLGMGELDWISFDEPIYAARHIVPMPSDNSELAAPESVALAIKDPAVTRRLYYGIAQTVSFIAMLRQAYPGSRLGDVEPYPALKYDEIVGAVEGIQKGSARRGIRGLDFLRLDVDWDLMERTGSGSWAEVKRIEDTCRAKRIAFSLIYWAADQPRLAQAGRAAKMDWRSGVLHQSRAYAQAGGRPDEIVIESWLQVPEHAVPETQPETFTASVLDFLRAFPPRASKSPFAPRK